MLIFTDRSRSPTATAPEGTEDAAADDTAADDAAADDPADTCESCLGWRAETQVISAASASVVMRSFIVRRMLLGVRAVVCGLICRKYERGENGGHRVRIIR